MPIANVPMMEHIVTLLRRHGFDDIVVTVAFMANHIRNYFGDGSELGVRMVYATEETPLGTAESVLNMQASWTSASSSSRPSLTDIDLGAIADFHAERALATIGLTPVENPLQFGIVITRDDGTIERFLEKPTWGGVQRHDQHRHLRAGARDLRLHRAGPLGRLQLEVFPAAGGRQAARGRGRGLLGGRRHAGGLRPGPQGRARRPGRGRALVRDQRRGTWGRGPTSTPTPASRGR